MRPLDRVSVPAEVPGARVPLQVTAPPMLPVPPSVAVAAMVVAVAAREPVTVSLPELTVVVPV